MTDVSTQFDAFLTKSRDEIPEPMNLPRGTYLVVLRGVFESPPRSEDKNGSIRFSYEVVEPSDDVDPGELEKFKEGNRSLKDSRPSAEFWLSNWNNVDNVWKHVALHGVEVKEYADLRLAYKAAVNKRVVCRIAPDNYVHQVRGLILRDKASEFKQLD